MAIDLIVLSPQLLFEGPPFARRAIPASSCGGGGSAAGPGSRVAGGLAMELASPTPAVVASPLPTSNGDLAPLPSVVASPLPAGHGRGY